MAFKEFADEHCLNMDAAQLRIVEGAWNESRRQTIISMSMGWGKKMTWTGEEVSKIIFKTIDQEELL